MLIDKIEELNKTLYRAFGNLKENAGHINKPEHQESIANKIMELYELDYKLIRGEFEAEEKRAAELDIRATTRKQELDRRKDKLKPKFRRLWYTLFLIKRPNRAEQLTEREAEANTDKFLNVKERAVEELEKIIEAADNADVRDVMYENQRAERTNPDKLNKPATPTEAAKPVAADSTLSAQKKG